MREEFEYKRELLEAFQALNCMQSRPNRDTFIAELEAALGRALHFQRHDQVRYDIWGLLGACLGNREEDALEHLVAIIETFEGNSRAIARVRAVLAAATPPALQGMVSPAMRNKPTGGPEIWGSIPSRNPNFTGREKLLRNLHQNLAADMTAVLPQALHGLGGIGKTQLAVEYVWRFAAHYDLVWWIPAEQPTLIRSSLAALGARLHLPLTEDVDKLLGMLHERLRRHEPYGRWLLVFDNADRPQDLGPFLAIPGGRVLVTSRNRIWNEAANVIEIGIFDRRESMELVRRRLPTVDPRKADLLAEHLGDLPIALDQATAWMSATATPIPEYLQLLRERVGQVLLENPPLSYPLSVVTTWGLAFDRLSRHAPAAAQLLVLCTFLGSEPISLRLLSVSQHCSLPPPLDAAVRDEILLRRAVSDIGQHGLAKIDPARNSIEIHRLVQAVLRDRLTDTQRTAYRRSAHELLAAGNPGDPSLDTKTWGRHAEIAPHIVTAGLVDSEMPAGRKVVLDQVRYLWLVGDYQSSRRLAEQAYRAWTERLGPNHQQTLVVGRFLANALRSLGLMTEARMLNMEVWTRARYVFGESHADTLAIANSVGADLRWLGRWKAARELDEQTYERLKRLVGENDPHTLNSANNLAVDLRFLCEFERARKLDDETVRRRRHVNGEDHPLTLSGISSLSRDHHGLGNFQMALGLQRMSLPVHQTRLGPHHSDVLRATRVHLQTLRRLGVYAEACDLGEELVARSRLALGESHADTLGALMALANSLVLVGRSGDARSAGEAAHSGYQSVLGDESPFTSAAATNLAVILRAVGEYTAARQLNQAALDGFRIALGEDHPFTIYCLTNMAVDYAMLREHSEARRLNERALASLQRMVGVDHPDTLVCASNLAVDLSILGETEAARALTAKTAIGMQRALGQIHPETLLTEAGQYNSLYVEPPTP